MADFIEQLEQLSKFIAENLQSAPNATVEELVERLKADNRIIQINTGNALAFQTLVKEGGNAYPGIHLHDFDEEKLDKVLKAFWRSLQPAGISNNVPRSGVAKFIGREQELDRLHTQLQQGNLVAISAVSKPRTNSGRSSTSQQDDRSSISAVEGMGGVGKTELAIQYTQQYAYSYEGGICWLFTREFNVGTQVVSFAQSRLNLKIPEELELPDQVAFCWQNWREGHVLLVLDDVVNYSRDVEPYLPPSASARFKVLMTTRLKFGPPIQSISLDVLSPEQSLELLIVLIGEERIQQELEIAKTLCKWLEHLPLGIELVGRYLLKRTDLSLSTLLFRLQQKAEKRQAIKHDALQRDEATGTSTTKRGVEAAFELSWDDLDENSQHLGKLLSLFAPAPIPWHLAESVEQKYCENSDDGNEFDVEELEKARTKLLDLHLLQLSQQKEQIYRLHSLIREFFRSKLEGEPDVTTSGST
ncbi:NB-ARC domain-containing protein [uncultured Nostoc sp.]|uniref:NB-ARC domain-containing protein n=1 Tax=uncultured Nostoc sp. TaxID=340711 RepID=UPI0035CBD29D